LFIPILLPLFYQTKVPEFLNQLRPHATLLSNKKKNIISVRKTTISDNAE